VSENVRVYLIDRAGPQANAFADKLAGRQGVELVGGAADVDEALEDITHAQPDVILVGTDVGGAGVVSAVERVLTVAGDVAVVILCTRADKALVAAGVRVGAAGSLDRAASDVDTITALHVYRDRQHGAQVDMKLAEPPAEKRSLRVSGALPRFPSLTEDVSYLNESPLLGAIEMADPVSQETETAETAEPAVDDAPTEAAIELSSEPEPEPEPEPGAPAAAEDSPPPEPEPEPPYTPQPANTPPEYAPPSDPTPAPEYTPPEPAQPDYPAPPETTAASEYSPPAADPTPGYEPPVEAGMEPAATSEAQSMAELEPLREATVDEAPLEAQAAPPAVEEPNPIDDDLQQMREMLRGEASAAAGKAPKRKIGGLFDRGQDKKSPWGPKDSDDEETNSS
jgi:DNA-binding NarL/FixJ family response regulator